VAVAGKLVAAGVIMVAVAIGRWPTGVFLEEVVSWDSPQAARTRATSPTSTNFHNLSIYVPSWIPNFMVRTSIHSNLYCPLQRSAGSAFLRYG
jgi:hypothetical protein